MVAPGHGADVAFLPAAVMETDMPSYRVAFAKEIMGVPFTIGAVDILRARDAGRALRAAEIRFARQHGVDDWRLLADCARVESGAENRS